MLKRIQKIQGIGTFASCLNSAKAEFRRTSLVFGYNSRGKSTLTEIFRSIESGNVDIVNNRLTIPGGKSQTVQFNIVPDGGGEVPFIFDGKKWQGSDKWSLKWRVFDSGFISRNVLSNDGVERGHKENLTKFVLGEEGVTKAQAIVEKRQETRRFLKESRQAADAIRKIAAPLNLEEFVGLQNNETIEELKAKYDKEVGAAATLHERIGGVDAIRQRPTVKLSEGYTPLSATLAILPKNLSYVLADIHTDARIRLAEHLDKHMNPGRGGREWLQSGLFFKKDNTCPFCEQEIKEQSQALIRQYAEAFDEGFAAASKLLKDELARIENLILKHKFPNFDIIHASNIAVIGVYPELQSDPACSQLLIELQSLSKEISELSVELQSEVELHTSSARSSIKNKVESLFEKVELEDYAKLEVGEQRFIALINDYNKLLQTIAQTHADFKNGIDVSALNADLAKIQAGCKEIAYRVKRLDNDKLCQDYLAKAASAAVGEKAADVMQAELDAEQSAYLDKFFVKIHDYFQLFGSRDFSIAKKLDDRGDFPVYTLSITYKQQEIGLDKLGLVFSESDRRALALSIFWASLALVEEKVLGNTIIILDDPVTSFDDNRISAAIRTFRSMAMQCRQMILLSHYQSFVKHYLELEEVGGDFSFVMLEKNDETSYFVVGDQSAFVHSEHHRRFTNIVDYINKKKSDPIQSDLRVYLEEEIKSRYRQQIFTLNIGNAALAEIIDNLHTHGCYPQQICNELHLFRQDLNPAHHKWDSRTPDDWASLAQDVLTLVYQRL
ncbi:AAA family ATPase [Herbaspirillum sp. SJZ107]|uniref:AAA family ATPase n=1 Tax=Herbaspirillum sp. SJZ107 TaxID=2572881 RepID=UPI001153E460|nr:AAA family ATPase [Herbaspirillum sp. SJZ107]TQK07195.1 wobble nucleotide-excising tRNase [Herbaspirillum sp. SJZ107]